MMRIGVDVGGTKIEAALIDEKGKILKRVRKPTQSSKGKKALISSILSAIKETGDLKKVSKIGIGLPGVIDSKGIFTYGLNVSCLHGMNVADTLQKSLGKKVFQENDADCFAYAEWLFGAAKGYSNVIGLILGTGIGGGIIIDGKIYRGCDGGAGEFGHTNVCCEEFEHLCGGPGIVRRYKKAGGKIKNPDPKKISESKEAAARKVMAETYELMGIGVANIINSFNPEIIVVGGGLSNLPIYGVLRKEVEKHAVPVLAKKVKIVRNKLGDSSGVIGAAFLE